MRLLCLILYFLAFDVSAETKVMGHIASFFKQSERPSKIVDYIDSATNRLKVDEMYPNLLQLKSDYFAFGFWTEEERSIHQWEDFRKVLTYLQSDRPSISLYLYVGSPEYAEDKNFCWDTSITGDQCQHRSKYTDYIRWAKEAASLHHEFPMVKGILIDDFIYSLSLYDSDSKLFTPDYLDEIRTKGKSIYADFRLETIWYLSGITAFHSIRAKNHIDGVHFFYRHIDDDSRKDLDSDRIVNELSMFTQAFEEHGLITISRDPDKPAIAGEVVTATGTQVSGSGDLFLGYWDNLYSKDGYSSYGWVNVKIYYDNKLVFVQDIMGGERDNTVKTITIPAAFVAQARKKNEFGGSIRLEVKTLKSYNRWGYHINLFPLRVSDSISWSQELEGDSKSGHILSLAKGSYNASCYLGVYAGSHSKFDVSNLYIKNILSHALKDNFIDGVIFWEAMMNPESSDIFTLSKDLLGSNSIVPNPVFPLEKSVSTKDAFYWEVSPGATSYEIWIDDYTTQNGDYYKHSWSYLTKDITCANGICHVGKMNEPTGNLTWWIRAWNNNNFSSWSRGVRVIKAGASSTSLIAPSQAIVRKDNVDFSWNRVLNASWYQLWINDNAGENIYKKWVKATSIACWREKCSFSLGSLSLPEGKYKWWIRAWNIKGLGDWSDSMSFSTN
jgi:hypothetical protein